MIFPFLMKGSLLVSGLQRATLSQSNEIESANSTKIMLFQKLKYKTQTLSAQWNCDEMHGIEIT